MFLALASMGLGDHHISISGLGWALFHLLAVYNLHGLMTFKQGQLYDLSLRAYYKTKLHKFVLGSSMILSFLLILFAPSSIWIPLLIINFLGLIYGTPLVKLGENQKRLKDFPLLKTPLVTMGVSCSVIFLPRVWAQREIASYFQPEHFVLALHIFINVLAGDLRDLKMDEKNGLATWPVRWGFQKVKLLSIFVAIGTAVISIMAKLDLLFVAVILLDALLLTLLTPKTLKARYHLLDLPHFVPGAVLLATGTLSTTL